MKAQTKEMFPKNFESEIVDYVRRGKLIAKDCGLKGSEIPVKLGLHLFWYELKLASVAHEYPITWDELSQLLMLITETYQLDSRPEAIRKLEALSGCRLHELVPTRARKIVSEIINGINDGN